jgi:hypothetical protein
MPSFVERQFPVQEGLPVRETSSRLELARRTGNLQHRGQRVGEIEGIITNGGA